METSPHGTATLGPDPEGGRRPRALPAVLIIVLAAATAVFVALRHDPGAIPGAEQPANSSRASWTPAPTGQTVSLAIDFGNGARREFAALPWSEGMTVGDLLRAARDFGPGVAFTQRGEGKMAFLTSLDGVANEASDGRFWLYEVDGRHADVSFEVQELTAGQRVLWAFKQPE